jgi:hypothetical protein
VTVDPAILAKYVGTYDRTDTPTPVKIEITLESGRLMMQSAGQEKREMLAESNDTFFLTKQKVELQFKPNRAGVLRYLAIDEDGRQTIAAKEQ